MRTALLLALALAGLAQTKAPVFEVASIRADGSGQETIEPGPASLTMRNARLISCIRWAYNVQDPQIDCPDFVHTTAFDVFAKSPGPVSVAVLRQMLQQLLTDRFHLAIHRENREMTVLVLTVSKGGHKLQPTDTEGTPNFTVGKMNATGRGATIEPLIVLLSRELREPVIDQTGLTGRYNYFFDIDPYFSEESRKAMSGAGPPPDANAIVAVAMQKELGLKVEAKKAPVEVIVVDHVDKAPTEN